MIVITARFQVLPEHADDWPNIIAEFTQDTRNEPGCRWFTWSRSLENSDEYVLLEAFDDDAAAAHVNSAHFKKAQQNLPQYLRETPKVINTTVNQNGWSELGELAVDRD